ncbi:MAG: hypothetical protein HY897_00025 [Deltaproteobacteria bacterium]|nr:hypothetical protein [Deltaproteobacteria bacterium]
MAGNKINTRAVSIDLDPIGHCCVIRLALRRAPPRFSFDFGPADGLPFAQDRKKPPQRNDITIEELEKKLGAKSAVPETNPTLAMASRTNGR